MLKGWEMKRNSANSLFEFDIYTEDNEVLIYISLFRFGKIFKTGVMKDVRD